MSAENRFLEGSFAPVTEEITAFDLPVTGSLPAGLNGRYLRNGPTRWAWTTPTTTGSWALAWSAACGCVAARRSGTQPVGPLEGRRRQRHGRGRAARCRNVDFAASRETRPWRP